MEYHIVVEHDPDDGGYCATVLELPEIIAGADSEEEAVRLAQEAIQFTLQDEPGMRHVAAKIFTVQVGA